VAEVNILEWNSFTRLVAEFGLQLTITGYIKHLFTRLLAIEKGCNMQMFGMRGGGHRGFPMGIKFKHGGFSFVAL
jgi:hypothetical protein